MLQSVLENHQGPCTSSLMKQGYCDTDLDDKGVADHLYYHNVVIGLYKAHSRAHLDSLMEQSLACTNTLQVQQG